MLAHPVAVGVRGAAREMDAPGIEFEEEERVEASEPDRLDREKSQAIIESAWARTNSRQLSRARAPAGDTPPCRRIFATVVAETATPTPASSPTIRR